MGRYRYGHQTDLVFFGCCAGKELFQGGGESDGLSAHAVGSGEEAGGGAGGPAVLLLQPGAAADGRGPPADEGARRLMEAYQQTVEGVRVMDRNTEGAFTLGLSPLFGACFFGDLLPGFSAAYPNIHIEIVEDGANRIDEKVARGEVDLGVSLNTDRLTAAVERRHFTTQRNVALLHESHPLAERDSITVADLREESFAIFNHNFILHRQILDACHAAGFRPKFALLTSQWDFMVEMVSKNHAVSILPKPVLEKQSHPHVRCIPLTDSMKYWDIVLTWNKEKYMPRSCRLFLDYISRNLPPDDL